MKRRSTWSILLIIILCIGLVIPSFASSINDDQSKSKFKRISFLSNNYVELQEVHLLKGEDQNTVSFTFDIYNAGLNDINFIDYWVRVKSKNGSEYSVNLIQDDHLKTRIAPHTKQSYTFYSMVSPNVELKDLVIEWIEWDFSMPDYIRVIGSYEIPEDYSNQVKNGQWKDIIIGSSRMRLSIDNFDVKTRNNNKDVEVWINYMNTGLRSLNIPDLQYYIRNEEGYMYSVQHEEESLTIQPRDSKKIKFTGKIPKQVDDEQWELIIVRTEAEGYGELPIASFELQPQERITEPLVPVEEDGSQVLTIDDIPVNTFIEHVKMFERDDNNHITLKFSLVNEGKKSVELPQYKFDIRTSEGIEYPMTYTNENIVIFPRMEESIELTTRIPTQVDITSLELVLFEPEDDSDTSHPLALYTVKESRIEPSEGVRMGMNYTFENEDGKYSVYVRSLQRLPWEDQDIVAAELILENRDEKSLPIPKITGSFIIDGIELDGISVHTVKLDNSIILQPLSKIPHVIYMKIPYTFEYNRLDLIVEELTGTGDEQGKKELVTFDYNPGVLLLPKVVVGDQYQIHTIGNRSSIAIRDVHSYSGPGSSLFYAELEVENLEKRPAAVKKLIAYLKTHDDLYIPLDIEETDIRLSPNGKALISATTQIPTGVNRRDLQMVIGEEISNEVDRAFVNAALLELPFEDNSKWNDFQNMSIYPYTISINDLVVALNENATLRFKYQLERDRTYQVVPEGHKLVMVFIDEDIPYEKTFEFETDLKLGTHIGEMTADISFESLNLKLEELGGDGFEVQVYVEYEGHRKLIGSQKVRRIVNNF